MRITAKLIWHYTVSRPRKGLNIIKTKIRNVLTAIFRSQRPTSFWPTSLMLRVTSKCNLRCVQCGQWGDHGFEKTSDSLPTEELSTNDYKSLLDAFSRKGVHIYIWGGEPLLRKDIVEIIKYASNKNLTVQLSTNGTLLRHQARELIDADLDIAYVSLDGPDTINNSIRRGAGNSFDEVRAGVKALLQGRQEFRKPVPIVFIIFTITPQNQNYIYETYEIVREWGVDVFQVQYGIFTNEEILKKSALEFEAEFGSSAPISWGGFIRDVSLIDPQVIKEQRDKIRLDIQEHHRQICYKETPSFNFDIAQYYKHPEELIRKERCTWPWTMIQVMPNGDLVMCVDFLNMTLGNLRDQPLEKLWNNDSAQLWRQRLITKGCFPACSRCGMHLVSKSKTRVLFSALLNRITDFRD